MASGPITLWQIDGETVETATGFFFLQFLLNLEGAPKSLKKIGGTSKSLQMVTAAMKLKDTCSLGKKL